MAASGPDARVANRARIYFTATVAGIALYLVLDVVAQSLPPHYNPISQA